MDAFLIPGGFGRREPDKVESGPTGKVPIDRLAEIAPRCRVSSARVVDAARIVTAADVARVTEYSAAYVLYRDDRESAEQSRQVGQCRTQ
jgi:hypothetical protein